MQDQGDRPVRSTRPSLLSAESQPAREHQRILSALDGAPAAAASVSMDPAAPARDGRRKPRVLAWSGLGLAVLAAGALFLSTMDDAPAPRETVVPAASMPGALHAPVAAAPAAAVSPAPVPAPAPAPAAQSTRAAPPAHDPANPLAALAPASAARPAPPDQLTRALEATPRQARREHSAEARSRPRPDAAGAAAKPPRHAAPAKEAKAKGDGAARSIPRQDSDVALLAALMSHIQARPKPATPAQQLEVCKQYNAAGEAQCRARLCQGVARKEGACKARPSRPSGE